MNFNEIHFNNANSRDTYFSVHNIRKAHNLSKGNGAKVGIIDWEFAYEENQLLYSGYANISDNSDSLFKNIGHGAMMATTLREIAPQCAIYAINATSYVNGISVSRIEYFEKSIQWAIENSMDILTYSNEAFFGQERARANEAVKKAVNSGLITTFIHNDSEYNIWPYGCLRFGNDQKLNRYPDVNIYHFDYNALFIPVYERYRKLIKAGAEITSGNDLPYFSFSSMSVVLAGFIAMLKSKNPLLSSNQCKQILIDTSYEITENAHCWYGKNPCKNVVDIGKALETLN